MATKPVSKPVTARDLVEAVTWSRALMDWGQSPDLRAAAEAKGLPSGALEELQEATRTAERLFPKRRARAVFLAAMAGRVDGETIRAVYHETIRAIHLCVPIAAEVLMDKLDNAKAPGSARVALEILKGCGVLMPAEPMKGKDRMSMLEEKQLREKDPETLKAEVLGFS